MDEALQERIDSRGISSIVTRLELIVGRLGRQHDGKYYLKQVINYPTGKPAEIIAGYNSIDQLALGMFGLKRALELCENRYSVDNLNKQEQQEFLRNFEDYQTQDEEYMARYGGMGSMMGCKRLWQ